MMKKIFVIAVALMMVAGMAYAEDRLTLNGNFRVWGWSTEGSDNWSSDSEDDWIGQRLRVGGKIAVADDVAVNFRMDFGESNWGQHYGPDGGYVVRPRNDADDDGSFRTLDIDRAYVDITKDFWELRAGQQYLGLGVAEVLDANVPAINLGIKPTEGMKLNLIYAKISENGDTNDDIADDTDFYAANISYDTDAFSLNIYYGMQTDESPAEAEPNGGGIMATTKLGMLNLTGEFDFFGGDNAAGQDYTGTQFYLAADAALTDMIKVGAEGFYAAGDDEDVQVTGWSDWFTFTPMAANTPMAGEYSAFEPNGTTSPFDPSGDGAGSLGGTIWGEVAPMEKLKLGAKIGYWEVDEDDATNLDSIFAYNAWVSYMIASNSTLSLTYMDSSPDFDDNSDDESYKVGVLALYINF